MIERYLSRFYNNRNGIKIKLIQDAVNKNIILKITKIKKAILQLEALKKLKEFRKLGIYKNA